MTNLIRQCIKWIFTDRNKSMHVIVSTLYLYRLLVDNDRQLTGVLLLLCHFSKTLGCVVAGRRSAGGGV